MNNILKYITIAEEEEKVAVISDSEEEDEFFECLDDSPHITLPPEVWAMVINCKCLC